MRQPHGILVSSPFHFNPTCVTGGAKFQAALEEWSAMRTLLSSSIKSYLDACTALTAIYAQAPDWSSQESAVDLGLKTVDLELDSLASEENALRDVRTSLATIRNKSVTLVRVNTLPPEILAQIFVLSKAYCIRSGSIYFNNIASVCAYWQRVAFNTPDLWTHIDVGPRTPVNLAEVLLRRAKDKPLHIHLCEPELERTPDIDISKTISVITPHIHRVCSMDMQSYNQSRAFICTLLNLWLAHGSTTLSKSLSIYRPKGERLLYSYGVTSKHRQLKCQSENANGVLSSLSTLHLDRVKFDWGNCAYRDLIDLRIDLPSPNPSISMPQLITILTANPALSTLKLGRLKITSPEDWVPPAPVELNHLKVLNLIHLQPGSLRLLLPVISLPSASGELSVGLSLSGGSQDELQNFLARSQMAMLYCLCSELSTLQRTLVSLPCLDTLILDHLEISEEPATEENVVASQPMQHSHISSVVLLSSVVSFTGLERFVTEHGVQTLSLEKCSAHKESNHDLQAMRASLLELFPKLGCSISDTDSTYRQPCRTIFDYLS
ncbi:hypothetical protein FRC12_005630 [Ceratobasidium sp. 428]|nr:hypothetical protein FRC12_005630 [Ceratobasidium sp. 428]